MTDRITELLKFESEAVKNIPLQTSFEEAINIIFEQVQVKGGKLVTSGMGKAGQIAHNMATTFSSTGTPAAFMHPSEAQHGDLGLLQKNDVLLLISNSGKTREIVELIDLARYLIPTIPIIVITGQKDSFLANEANATIWTGNPGEICPLGLSPTTSTTVMNVIGNILVVLMMEKIKFSSMDYAKRHHGGYLGDKSRTQAKGK
ncbi:SIS domain-containing protein [Saccharicrinis sp. FJH2]|uniref:SIS domain-containing protein n=1 Tax=Saccharicrinis sp. FJH65 TaxID=3344659 RepID=UPI0035F42B03